MQPQDPRRQPSLLSSLDGLAQPAQVQPIQTGMVLPTTPAPMQPTQQPTQQPVVPQPTSTDQDANLVPDELTDEIRQVTLTPEEVAETQKYNDAEEYIAAMTQQENKPEQALLEETKNYESAEDFAWAQRKKEKEFRDAHAAPSAEDTPPEQRMEEGGDFSLAEIKQGFMNVPENYFDPQSGPRNYMYNTPLGKESLRAIREYLDGKKDTLTAYRTVPKDLQEDKFVDGDWITFNKQYATNHGESRFGENEYKIIEQEVDPKDVWWDGNDINEWGYDTNKQWNKYTDIWNQAQQPEQKAATQPQPVEFNDRFGKLREAARNYATPEEFIQDINKPQGYKDVGFIDQPDLLNEKIYEVPLDKISEFQRNAAVSTARYKTNAEPTDISDKPVTLRVEDDGTISIADGIHRVAQAIKNGDTSINAIFEPNNNGTPGNLPGGYSLSELFNQANRADTQTAIEIPPQPLRGAKKYTESDIKDQKPDIQLAKDITVKDTSGQPVELKEGENLTPYMMKDGRVVIQDGVASTISPSTLDQIEKSSYSAEVSEKFAPELKDKEIEYRGDNYQDEIDDFIIEMDKLGVDASLEGEGENANIYYRMYEPDRIKEYRLIDADGEVLEYTTDENEANGWENNLEEGQSVDFEYIDDPIIEEYPDAFAGTYDENDLPEYIKNEMPEIPYSAFQNSAKYESYSLPGGEDYREILLTSETPMQKELDAYKEKISNDNYYWDKYDKFKKKLFEKYGTDKGFNGGHFEIDNNPNLEGWARMTNREYDGKKVAFLEEIQSDYAREARERGMIQPYEYAKEIKKINAIDNKINKIDEQINPIRGITRQLADNLVKSGLATEDDVRRIRYYPNSSDARDALYGKYNKTIDRLIDKWSKLDIQKIRLNNQLGELPTRFEDKLPYNPDIKNWKENTLKMALGDAVAQNADIFSWTTGKQQGDRYGLSRVVNSLEKLSHNDINRFMPSTDPTVNTKTNYGIRLDGDLGNTFFIVDKKTNKVIQTSNNSLRELVGQPLGNVIGTDLAIQVQKGRAGKKWDTPEQIDIGNRKLGNLYDTQIKTILEKMLKTKVKYADMNIEKKDYFYKSDGSYENKLENKVNFDDIKVGDFIQRKGETGRIVMRKSNNKVYTFSIFSLDRVGGFGIHDEVLFTNRNPKTGNSWIDDYRVGLVKPAQLKRVAREFIRANEKQRRKEFKGKGQPMKYPLTVFDRSSFEGPKQPYIELTPVIKAIIKGEKPPIKASGRKY